MEESRCVSESRACAIINICDDKPRAYLHFFVPPRGRRAAQAPGVKLGFVLVSVASPRLLSRQEQQCGGESLARRSLDRVSGSSPWPASPARHSLLVRLLLGSSELSVGHFSSDL